MPGRPAQAGRPAGKQRLKCTAFAQEFDIATLSPADIGRWVVYSTRPGESLVNLHQPEVGVCQVLTSVFSLKGYFRRVSFRMACCIDSLIWVCVRPMKSTAGCNLLD